MGLIVLIIELAAPQVAFLDRMAICFGIVVAGAWPGSYPAGLDFGAEAHMNRPRIIFSRACSEPNPDYPNWDENRIFDVVWRLLSNGALNLVPDKSRAFAEMYRVLKPGAHFCVSDIVVHGDLPESVRKSVELYAGCVAGALKRDEYLALIRRGERVGVA